jgi:hypothetical protein
MPKGAKKDDLLLCKVLQKPAINSYFPQEKQLLAGHSRSLPLMGWIGLTRLVYKSD